MEASDGGVSKLKTDMETKYHALLHTVANLITSKVTEKVPGAALILVGKRETGERLVASLKSPSVDGPLQGEIETAVQEAVEQLNTEPKLLDALTRAGFFNADS